MSQVIFLEVLGKHLQLIFLKNLFSLHCTSSSLCSKENIILYQAKNPKQKNWVWV
jgi:hypothetical protein